MTALRGISAAAGVAAAGERSSDAASMPAQERLAFLDRTEPLLAAAKVHRVALGAAKGSSAHECRCPMCKRATRAAREAKLHFTYPPTKASILRFGGSRTVNARLSMRDLVGVALPTGHRDGIFVMLRAYFDDSGTHGGSPVTGMGGLIGTVAQWEKFEIRLGQATEKTGTGQATA